MCFRFTQVAPHALMERLASDSWALVRRRLAKHLPKHCATLLFMGTGAKSFTFCFVNRLH